MIDRDERAHLLIDAARRGDDPPPGARKSIEDKLMKRLAVGVAAGSALTAKAAGASALATLAKAAAVGAALSVTVIVAKIASRPSSGPTSPGPPRADPTSVLAPVGVVEPLVPVSPLPVSPLPVSPLPVSPLPVSSVSVPPDAPSLSAPALSGQPPAAPGPAPRIRQADRIESTDRLRAEAAGLRAAHEAMQAGDAGRALALIADQERVFHGGALGQERAAVRILALCKLGRTEEATSAAKQFLATSPHSPLAPRVRDLCSVMPP